MDTSEYYNTKYFGFDTFSEADRIRKAAFEVLKEQGYLTLYDVYCLIYKQEINYPDIYKRHGWFKIDILEITDGIDTRYYDNKSYNFHVWFLRFPLPQNIEDRIRYKEKENDFKWKQKYLTK